MVNHNLELKVACGEDDLAPVRAALAGLPAVISLSLRQRDTYFVVPKGRLKLREMTPADGSCMFELIAYERPDVPGERWSTYDRLELTSVQGEALKQALAQALGVLTVVTKQRDVAIWHRTRIHLDEVEGLGAFVELETVTGAEQDDAASAELAMAAARLGLVRLPVISGSYSDLLMQLQRE